MKIYFLITFLCIFSVTAENIYSQSKTVSAELKNVTLKDAFRELEENSDYLFLFMDNTEKGLSTNVNVSFHNKSMGEILDFLLKNTDLTYSVVNRQVTISKKPGISEDKMTLKIEQPAIREVQQTHKTITGTVTDANGESIIGANIIEAGTSNGTITDINGKFTLQVANDASIRISYIGYLSQTVNTAGKNQFNITLLEDTQALEEVVVVGYGTQRKENLTGAVSSVDVGKTVDSRPISDIGRALQGAVPGLTISTKSGEIGGAPTIKIRGGVGSPNGNANPLILVDNVEISDITLVNPDDIESISVLKDAASSSIYGARAAFGVILITTKAKQQHEKLSISYSNNFAWRTPTKKPEQLPGWQQAEINLAGMKVAPSPANSYNVVANMIVDQKTVDGMKAWAEKYGDGKGLGLEMVYGRDFEIDASGAHYYRTWDWYDMYIKDWMPQQTHNLSISGGNQKTNYGLTLGYLHQEGLTKANPDVYDRYNANLTLNTEISKQMSVRANAMYTRTDFDKPFMYGSDLYDHMYYLYRWQPMYPYGTFEGKPFRSALTELQQAPMTNREKDYMRLGTGFTLKPMNGLTVDVDFIYTSIESRYKKFGDKVYAYDIFTAHNSLEKLQNSYRNYISSGYDYVYEERGRTQMLTNNIVATYSKKIENHDFKVLAGSNIEKSEYRYLWTQKKGLLSASKPELNLAIGDPTTSSEHTHWAVAGFFGRINYAFKDRYLLELNGRYDGSSRFPKDERFAFFPSISAGYRISEEKFMQKLYPALSSLKLRASYGSIGNQDVGLNRFISTLDGQLDSWVINGVRQTSVSTPTVVSKSLTWEKVKTVDFGFDSRFINNKLGITFDWYKRTTSDVLATQTLPATLGAASPYQNMGELETLGWELSADFRHKFSNGLTITLGGQITDYKTKVNKWSNNTSIPSYGGNGNGWSTDVNVYKEGMILGDIWGLQVDRLLQKSDFDAAGKLVQGIPDQTEVFPSNYKFAPGDVLYKDLDGDGYIRKGVRVGEAKDMSIIGNTMPRFEYGFSLGVDYKEFDFSAFFQGIGRRELWAMGNQILPGYTAGEPYYKGAEDFWSPENTNAFYPRPMNYSQVASGNYQVNDRYLLNMAYLRCKTITLGYTLPKFITTKVYINNLRIYFTAENPFEFDNVKPDIDPEIDIRYVDKAADSRNFGRSYPYQRTLSFGLQLTF
ncbi:TonB-dependent receptor [Petrimonas sp.]|uniref:TonB-dependent receptor n=1 Tax=Petrimonas sp. TaxID=2023866 RepID=UPI003F51148B